MDNIIIRNVEEKDIPNVVDIQIEGWIKAYAGIIDDNYLKSMDRDERIEKMKNHYQDSGFIIAELNNEVVGFCRYIDNNSFTQDMSDIDCELLALYVRPDLKYNGIGTKMFQFIREEFKNKNKTQMILWCLNKNYPSKKFYEKMGGKIIKQRTFEINGEKYLEDGFIYNI